MLKTKFRRARFFGHGLLLLVPHVTMVKGSTTQFSKVVANPSESQSNRYNSSDTAIFNNELSTAIVADSSVIKEDADIPKIELNEHAAKYVHKFLRSERESLLKIKQRSEPYFTVIDSVFKKYKLPLELKYLAVIESELKPTARSNMGAAGAWQLMPTTARELGLKVNKKVDERTNFYKSTVAAAKYLRSLYAQFGDWLLVIAAYNSGPGFIFHAISKAHSRNFWALQRYLPEESQFHVRRFIGAHYYFEGTGSITTLTKSEVATYKSEMAAYKEELARAGK